LGVSASASASAGASVSAGAGTGTTPDPKADTDRVRRLRELQSSERELVFKFVYTLGSKTYMEPHWRSADFEARDPATRALVSRVNSCVGRAQVRSVVQAVGMFSATWVPLVGKRGAGFALPAPYLLDALAEFLVFNWGLFSASCNEFQLLEFCTAVLLLLKDGFDLQRQGVTVHVRPLPCLRFMPEHVALASLLPTFAYMRVQTLLKAFFSSNAEARVHFKEPEPPDRPTQVGTKL
jgi:hypothetical protein